MRINWGEPDSILAKIEQMQTELSHGDVVETEQKVAAFVQEVLKEAPQHIEDPEMLQQFYQACNNCLEKGVSQLERNEAYTKACIEILSTDDAEQEAIQAKYPFVAAISRIDRQLFGSLREATNLAEQKVAEKRQKEQIEKEHIEKAAQQSQAIETERSKILRQLEEPEVIFTQHGFRLMPALDVSVAEEFKLEGASPYISIESLRRDLEDFKSQVQEEDRVLVELAESHLRLCHALELESLTCPCGERA